MNSKYEVTVLVLTYNFSVENLKRTLKSILLQRKIEVQIVISDDGSKEFPEETIEDFFKIFGFSNYKIIVNEHNVGTVSNMYGALIQCDGKYIKTISPGDFLNGYYVLRNWVDYMELNNVYISFSDVIFYQMKNDKVLPLSLRLNPQCIKNGLFGSIRHLVYDDFWHGAAILVEKKILVQYMKMINLRVKYAEDLIYRIMEYLGEDYIFFPEASVFYEWGTGISNCNNSVWEEKLSLDCQVVDEMIIHMDGGDVKLKKLLIKRINMKKKRGVSKRIYGIINLPGYYLFGLKAKLFPRKSSLDLNETFINEIIR